jgi:4-hydroxy-tetrahydrodipicolinate reductase
MRRSGTGIKVAVCGAAGRMGSEVLEFFQSVNDVVVTHGVEKKGHPSVGQRVKGVPIVEDLASVIDLVDCLVDFTAPQFTSELIKKARKAGKPLVIGTTNLRGDSLRAMKESSRETAIVLYPNMAPGMNVLFKYIPDLARSLGRGFDISIVETHHRTKRDSPSGTARKLAQALKSSVGSEPGITSLRSGDIIGEHVITLVGEGEMIRLTHLAFSRRAFAAGALLAVRFAVAAKPGLYSMFDVLGLR